MGATKRVRTMYGEAFEEFGLISRQTEHAFYPGSDNEPARMTLVRDGLVPGGPNNLPVWRFVGVRLYWLKYELARYKKQVVASAGGKGQPRDSAVDKDNHAANCLEYYAAAEAAGYCDWSPPDPPKRKLTPVQQFMQRQADRRKAMNPNSGSVVCGAGASEDLSAWM
jgi:hypothetical protein